MENSTQNFDCLEISQSAISGKCASALKVFLVEWSEVKNSLVLFCKFQTFELIKKIWLHFQRRLSEEINNFDWNFMYFD